MLARLLDWFGGLPPLALYLALAFAAAIENVFPPLPSDTVVAFGSFIAARGQASALGAFLATLGGNLLGAMFMYWVGARYGAERVLRRFGSAGGGRGRIEALYGRYGIWALAVSRFLPGVRAVVPPVAGALRIGAVRAALAMGLASAVWYGGITYLAFTAGANFEALQARIAQGQRWLGIGAGVLVVVGLAVWWVRRRRVGAASR
ncbi:MAG: DedA family protein [Gemmatirosa sp.]|nr:DedA family protein [Gemmatirosa sp.]